MLEYISKNRTIIIFNYKFINPKYIKLIQFEHPITSSSAYISSDSSWSWSF